MKKLLLALTGCFLLATAFADPAITPVKEGVDYTLLTSPVPVTPEPKGVVNVKEFFMFWCIHCKLTEPYVERFLVPNKSIDLQRIPLVAGNNKEMIGFAKLAATLANPSLQALKLGKLYTPIFNNVIPGDTISTELSKADVVQTFLSKNGYSKAQVAQFMTIYNSAFDMNGKVAQYKTQTTMYNITGTPTFIVADKYVVSPAQPERLTQVVTYLVNKVNQDNAASTKPATTTNKTVKKVTKTNAAVTNSQ